MMFLSLCALIPFLIPLGWGKNEQVHQGGLSPAQMASQLCRIFSGCLMKRNRWPPGTKWPWRIKDQLHPDKLIWFTNQGFPPAVTILWFLKERRVVFMQAGDIWFYLRLPALDHVKARSRKEGLCINITEITRAIYLTNVPSNKTDAIMLCCFWAQVTNLEYISEVQISTTVLGRLLQAAAGLLQSHTAPIV